MSERVGLKPESRTTTIPSETAETMAIFNPTVKFTYKDYVNAPEDKRYELIDGDLLITPAPGELHQRVSILLGSKLFQFAFENSLGRVYVAPFDVVLSEMDVVQPDVLYVSNERSRIITPENVQGAPDMVVEILSPSTATRDTTFKRVLYSRHGVREYWIVDTEQKTITVLLPGNRGLRVAEVCGEGETLTSATLQGFKLNVDEVFQP
ncbi:MAG: Uma2 family endonuclease [Gemmatimonadota bacterium]|nr:Uma2 family endonuclease [Gemmatimonadota bacterium]